MPEMPRITRAAESMIVHPLWTPKSLFHRHFWLGVRESTDPRPPEKKHLRLGAGGAGKRARAEQRHHARSLPAVGADPYSGPWPRYFGRGIRSRFTVQWPQ